MRRVVLACLCLAALVLAPVAGAKAGKSSWAADDISTVVASGLMEATGGDFRPNDPLTKGELAAILGALGKSPVAPTAPESPVTLQALDAALVKASGLALAAKTVRMALVNAGLTPPARAGNEVVARLLGLRLNHPQEQDSIELLPANPVTRAETAYSLARFVEARGSGTIADVRAAAMTFSVPELSDWQRTVLRRAVSFIGYPYIWGGTSEKAQSPFGKRVSGGFDCSGFVWRVYKVEPFDGAPGLATVLEGRTTYEMSGEVKKKDRISFDQVQPADVVFFGSNGPASKPGQVGHMGINLGNGWFMHSSGRGTTIAMLSGWYADTFAWARRPLAEAGLE